MPPIYTEAFHYATAFLASWPLQTFPKIIVARHWGNRLFSRLTPNSSDLRDDYSDAIGVLCLGK